MADAFQSLFPLGRVKWGRCKVLMHLPFTPADLASNLNFIINENGFRSLSFYSCLCLPLSQIRYILWHDWQPLLKRGRLRVKAEILQQGCA